MEPLGFAQGGKAFELWCQFTFLPHKYSILKSINYGICSSILGLIVTAVINEPREAQTKFLRFPSTQNLPEECADV